MQSDLDKLAEHLVRNEVHLCVSSLISTLAGGYGRGTFGVGDLCDQAAELSCPIDDWDEAATQAGWTQTPQGRWRREPQDGETIAAERLEPFLGSGPFVMAESAQDACNLDNLDPYQWEIFEHWAVSEWLGRDLEELGERVDFDFAGLVVWTRTTTGQSIDMDSVMLKVAKLVRDRAAGIVTPATAARREAEFTAFMTDRTPKPDPDYFYRQGAHLTSQD